MGQAATTPTIVSDVPPTDTVNAYLDAFYSGDFAGARTVLRDDFHFSGPFVDVTGAERFLESAEGLRRIVRGHRLLRQWRDADDVCSIYDVTLETPLGSGRVTMSEWDRVEAGRVAEGRVVFDSVAFRSLLPPAPDHAT